MPKKKYLVKLDNTERQQLEELLRGGQHGARKLTRARILLKADAGCPDEEIVEALDVGRATVERLRERFVARRLDCLHDEPRPGAAAKLDEKVEARLIAEACSAARKAVLSGRWSYSQNAWSRCNSRSRTRTRACVAP